MGDDPPNYAPEWALSCAVVIPCLNEASAVPRVVHEVRRRFPHVFVIDDGSTDDTARAAAEAGAEVLRHATRCGKGAALETGLRYALARGFTWAITLDGDGQHDIADVTKFCHAAEQTGASLIVGNRMPGAASMPLVRRWVNRFMSRCLSQCAGMALPDSQCGFRLMRLAQWSMLELGTPHFVYESELLIAWARAGYRVEFVPIRVIYGCGETSRIAPLRDAARWLSWLVADGGLRRALANDRWRS